MVEAVTNSIDALVQCVEEDVVYKDLDGLRQYIQWTKDFIAYEESLSTYQAHIKIKREESVQRMLLQFHSKNGRLRENAVWM